MALPTLQRAPAFSLSVKIRTVDGVWDEYRLDQEINDRGVALDIDFVHKAIEIDTLSRSELTDMMRELTELENPNSVAQMKAWLAEKGLETETLGKSAVKELLKTAPDSLREVLALRQDLARSSVKKYTAGLIPPEISSRIKKRVLSALTARWHLS